MKGLVALAIVLACMASACAFTRLDNVSCPDGGTTLSYDNFGQRFFETWCNSCHSAPVEYRQGAPEQFVFDTQARVQKYKRRIFERAAADNDSMPPGPAGPSQKERDQLAEWLACGAP